MQQFDVFRNPDPAGAEAFPYIVALRSDAVSETASVIVAPLVPREPTGRLHPNFTIADESFAPMVTDLAAIPRRLLREPEFNLESERHRIIGALDLLFTGL